MLRVLYGSDFHGSDLVFRKFLRAGLTYEADALVVGGDITGKAIVPLVHLGDGRYEAYLFGTRHEARTQQERIQLQKLIGNVGFYAVELEQDEVQAARHDSGRLEEMFTDLMRRKLTEWIALAEEHLRPKRIGLYLMPGNDDIHAIDEALTTSAVVRNPDGERLWLDDDHELVGLGAANPTPWQCPRDLPEDELAARIHRLTAQLERPQTAVFVFHVPPYDSGLDMAPELDAELRIKHAGGQVLMKPVGSTAVRAAIEQVQPLLSLHGHIHESPGFRRIGRTLCVNAGSEYAEGILKAAVINLEPDRVKGYLPISG